MKILVIGSGGREHALAWKISQSPRAEEVFVAPGNAGTAEDVQNIHIAADDQSKLLQFVERNNIDLTVVGPEAPLTNGIVDLFEKNGRLVFGPSRSAARLEGSKVFCKKVLLNAGIPTGSHAVFRSAENALHHVDELYPPEHDDLPLVVKASGLAAGKGVFVCSTRQEVIEAIDQVAEQRVFGDAGNEFILEERLEGEEVSVLAITDGSTILTLPPAQDHKPAFDGDLGPNTGGMGAYSPAPLVDSDMQRWIEENILVPTVHEMNRSGCPFKGILYAGLMMTPTGPRVLEYNVRFGDPECQPLLMRLQTDLVDIIEATLNGRLDQLEPPTWDPRASVCVVMASEGYPGSYEKGQVIEGIAEADALEQVKVFHAGTALDNGQVVVNGGRVLGITALGETVAAAQSLAYEAVEKIHWPGAWCRSDIASKALEVKGERLESDPPQAERRISG
jgi:phosphoribosylamine--glycine ligase